MPEPGKTNQTKLYITIDDPQRVRVYLEENRAGGHIVSFEVDPAFAKEVEQNAVRQAEARANRDAPEISDPSKTTPDIAAKLKKGGSSAYGLPANWIAKLEKAARPGTFRIER